MIGEGWKVKRQVQGKGISNEVHGGREGARWGKGAGADQEESAGVDPEPFGVRRCASYN